MLQQMETSDISNDKEVVASIRSLNADKKLTDEQLLHIQKELWQTYEKGVVYYILIASKLQIEGRNCSKDMVEMFGSLKSEAMKEKMLGKYENLRKLVQGA